MHSTNLLFYLCNLLYKIEKPSVRLRSFLVRPITLPSMHGSMPDLLKVKAMSSGIHEFISKSYRFSTQVCDSHLCRMKQPLTKAIQCTIVKTLDCDTLVQWSGIESLQLFGFKKFYVALTMRLKNQRRIA